MSGDAKYISLYYSLVHQGASDFYKEIIKGPGGNMSYLPPWAPTSGSSHYPPHMLPPHPSTSSSHSPQTTHSTTQAISSASVYQNLSPVVKSVPPASVSIIQSNTTTKPSTASSSGSTATTTSSSSTLSIDDPYEPQGFQRTESPPLKRPNLGESLKSENHATRDSPVPEMILGLAGPSTLDLKTGMRKAPAKYPAPEQLPGPVMFSYQGRGRPRKNWTHATGLPTMIPVTHPPIIHTTTHSTSSSDDLDDEENRPFKCNLCGKGFKLKGGLMQHERTHSTDRPYVCPDCGKLFRQPTHLQQHLRIHTGEKPYECAFCDKSFRQRTILNQHLRIHTGEKPYACMECGKQFRQKAILDQHFRTHLGEKPYACPHPSCRKHFREMATLISHMKCHKDVPDPRLVLQQAKQLIKEERQDHTEGPDRGLGQDGVGQDRLAQDLGMGPNRVGQDSLGQDRVNQDRAHVQREGGSSEQGYQNSGDPRHNHRPFPTPNSSESSVAQKSPHPLSQHSADQSENSTGPPQQPHSQSLPTNMMPTPPQMAMANLIPYPHSIFPATSYMMPQPDPRQYHPQAQQQHRPTQ